MTRASLLRFDRASLLAATLVAVSLNRLFGKMAESVAISGWTLGAASLFGVSAVIWIALTALIDLGGNGSGAPPRAGDWWLSGGALFLCLLPTGWEAAIALLGVSAISIYRFTPGSRERRLAIIGMALTGPLLFAPLALAFLSPELLRFDAAFVSLISGQPAHGNVVEFADPAVRASGRQMVIFAACSSFHNVSMVGVLFAVVSQMLNIRLTWSMWLLALLMIAVTIVINGARLTAIALFPQYYDFLHTGLGGQAIGFAGLIAAGAIILLGALRGAKLKHA